MTKKYYISVLIAAPFLAALVVTARLPVLISFLFAGIVQVLSITGGYYLGKRENEFK